MMSERVKMTFLILQTSSLSPVMRLDGNIETPPGRAPRLIDRTCGNTCLCVCFSVSEWVCISVCVCVCDPHPGVVPLSLEFGDLLFLLQKLLPADIQLFAQGCKLLLDNKKQAGPGSSTVHVEFYTHNTSPLFPRIHTIQTKQHARTLSFTAHLGRTDLAGMPVQNSHP